MDQGLSVASPDGCACRSERHATPMAAMGRPWLHLHEPRNAAASNFMDPQTRRLRYDSGTHAIPHPTVDHLGPASAPSSMLT